ncbi:MAG: Glycosyl transferase group 1 [Promethearchaeota archaeon]|nr:MAG: Glycosyl transferase group 1 [Candidatus Lokiarchaeota archaeon]
MINLKILKVIHGYPPYYMAGSEVYSYTLCNELPKKVDLTIFTRIEDNFSPMYQVRESIESGIRIIRVNKAQRDYSFRSKYIDNKLARIFEQYLREINPDIVHIGHLSHLTVLIVDIIKKYEIPIIFTLHDYWMICIRGQLIGNHHRLCSGPTVEKCFECNQKYFVSELFGKEEIRRWLDKMNQINEKIDLFIAPSKFLKKIYINNGIPAKKLHYMDYGFNKKLFQGIKKNSRNNKIRFGFLGRLIPVKGIDLLIECFNGINPKKAELKIFGRLDQNHQYLQKRIRNTNIHFYGGYNYHNIGEVLSKIDVLVVPSIWYENSPLVIHEALLVNIPVITSNLGGMKELIQDKQNGLLFEPGNKDDLSDKIHQIIETPDLIKNLSNNSTKIRSIQEDAEELLTLYKKLVRYKTEGVHQIAH